MVYPVGLFTRTIKNGGESMFSAREAREMAEKSEFDSLSEWNFLDTIQYNRIEKMIRHASARKQKALTIRSIRERVLIKLERNGYRVTEYCGIPGTWIAPSVGIYWDK